MKKIIVDYYSVFHEHGGYGQAASGYVLALNKYITDNNLGNKLELRIHGANGIRRIADKEVSNIAKSGLLYNKNTCDPCDCISVLITHMQPSAVTKSRDTNLIGLKQNCDVLIHNTVFECTDIPKSFVHPVCEANAVIVPSRLCYEAFSLHNDSVYQIPHSIKASPVQKPFDFADGKAKNSFEDRSRLRFLIVTNQLCDRKGLDVALKAYFSEFDRTDDVELVVKTTLGRSYDSERWIDYINGIKQYFLWKHNDIPRINFLPSYLDRESMAYLYEMSDVVVCTSRGEGFCLPLAEGLLYGKPGIYTSFGGHTDFMRPFVDDFYDDDSDGWGFPVDCDIDTVVSNTYPFDMTHAYWATPSISSTRSQMRKAYDIWKTGNLYHIGKAGSTYIEQYCSPDRIGGLLYDAIIKEVARIENGMLTREV